MNREAGAGIGWAAPVGGNASNIFTGYELAAVNPGAAAALLVCTTTTRYHPVLRAVLPVKSMPHNESRTCELEPRKARSAA